jgi:hypothetical protein
LNQDSKTKLLEIFSAHFFIGVGLAEKLRPKSESHVQG